MGKLFVITGANKGLGLDLVKDASNKAFKVEGVGKSAKSENIPIDVPFTQLDCSQYAGVLEFWKKINEKYDKEYHVVLVNNAGTYYKKEFLKMPIEDIESLLRDNLLTSIYMTRGVLDFFDQITIVNIVSVSAIEPGANKAIYGAAKAAMLSFFNSLRLELKDRKVKIININPHTINTWSPNKEPNAIESRDLADWIIDLSVQERTFEIRDAVLLPF